MDMVGWEVGGIRVVVDKFLCRTDRLVQRRTHRKSRINKKWRKKYGFDSVCKGHTVIIGRDARVCPHVKAKLDKRVSLQASLLPEKPRLSDFLFHIP